MNREEAREKQVQWLREMNLAATIEPGDYHLYPFHEWRSDRRTACGIDLREESSNGLWITCDEERVTCPDCLRAVEEWKAKHTSRVSMREDARLRGFWLKATPEESVEIRRIMSG